MAENPNEIRRSWNLQANWQSGLPVINKLVPIPFQKIALNFVQTWREENVPTLDWGAKNFSVVIPEGVQCTWKLHCLPLNTENTLASIALRTSESDRPGMLFMNVITISIWQTIVSP